jgi:hypothetical protein
MYGIRIKPSLFLSTPVKVTDNNKDISLQRNLSIFHTLRIRNVLWHSPCVKVTDGEKHSSHNWHNHHITTHLIGVELGIDVT